MTFTFHTLRFAALALALLGVSAAHAQAAGSWLLRAGLTNINPDVKSGDLSAPSLPGTKSDVEDATSLGGGVTYMVNDHFALDLPLALPFKHKLTGAGAIAGVGKIGEVKVLPATLFAQYRFGEASDRFQIGRAHV